MSADPTERPRRDVVSFVRRGSRLSHSRQEAWDRSHTRWVLEVPLGERDTVPEAGARLDPATLFGRSADLVVEIGSGQGENIAAAAAADPSRDHLAFEVYLPGLAQTLDRLERAEDEARASTGTTVDNVRLLPLDALFSLPVLLAPHSVSEVWIFFPDPWHKSRHHKRRLVSAPLLEILESVLVPGGILRVATDWAEYASHMREVLDSRERWHNLHPDGPRPSGTASDTVPDSLPVTGWSPRFTGRVLTSFERKSHDAGRLVWELTYAVRPSTPDTPGPQATSPEQMP